MAITVQTDSSYPNRVQLLLGNTLTGPLTSTDLGPLFPARDLAVYIDGTRQQIRTFTFDADNNRYLIFTETPFNQQGLVQVNYHIPDPPFLDTASKPMPGFCIIGTYVVGPPDPDESSDEYNDYMNGLDVVYGAWGTDAGNDLNLLSNLVNVQLPNAL